MESPRKFNDCYFYYYSTCTKGDNCVFRHEPAALGCETMCAAWQQGNCDDKKCRLRHMELRKNRKQIPCYWENQPGGCRKKHCPFMHKNPDARTDGIAPSQPALPNNANVQNTTSAPELVGTEQPTLTSVPAPVPGVAQVPLLWQQQRQVVLDSAILGVLPASADYGRRVLSHETQPPNPYGPMPVDPLVVNFDEESDNESAPSSTPTKRAENPKEETQVVASESQELLLLQKIQAEAAAYYSYEDHKEHKTVRTNLNVKYERFSLDDHPGKKIDNKNLDFKVLSLDEIRARKRYSGDPIIPPKSITLNLRKRKLSHSQETIVDSANKIIKVVRSNSIVYRKVDHNATNSKNQPKTKKLSVDENRIRTLSEQSDSFEVHDDELEDDCYEFKRVNILENHSKPKLIRSKSNSDKSDRCINEQLAEIYDDDEVEIVGETVRDSSDIEVIEVDDSARIGEPIDIVDLSEIEDTSLASDCDLGKNTQEVGSSTKSKNISDDDDDSTGVSDENDRPMVDYNLWMDTMLHSW